MPSEVEADIIPTLQMRPLGLRAVKYYEHGYTVSG